MKTVILKKRAATLEETKAKLKRSAQLLAVEGVQVLANGTSEHLAVCRCSNATSGCVTLQLYLAWMQQLLHFLRLWKRLSQVLQPLTKGSMAKRLRGHQKALQLGRAEKQPCKRQKGPDQSALATELLSLWGHGHLSAVKVQRLANAAMLDGASHSEIVALAKAGNFGMGAGNVHKALVTRFCKNLVA